MDVAIGAHRRRNRDEHRADQQIAGDFLGPGRRIVERVAGKELVEDVGRQHPEERERDPGFQRVA